MAKGDICEVCGSTKNVSQSKKYQRKLCGKHTAQLDQYGKIFSRTVFDMNEIITIGDVSEIILYDKHHNECNRSKVNSRHIDLIKNHKWRLGSHGYLMTTIDGKGVLIHRLITGAKDGEVVDHKDHDTLNNLDDNLRVCSRQDNGRNSVKRKNNTSGITGVVWHKQAKKWHAQIMVNRKTINLGLYIDKNDAIAARKAAEIKYFGDFRYKEVI
jgi:hypothetical protein